MKVLDFSRVLAGPFAGRMLSDLGADVVKVEAPEGDVTRLWGKVIGGIPGYYNQQNAGKRNICVDLKAPGATALVLELVRRADIVIENYRPGVMARLGLGYPDIQAINPRIVMLSISGFGRGSPDEDRATYASVIHAEAGLLQRTALMSATGELKQLPLNLADSAAALHGLVATLAALLLRERTGVGQHIDLSMMDATIVTDDFIGFDLEEAHATKPGVAEVWQSGAGPVLVALEFRYLWQLLHHHFLLEDPASPDLDDTERVALRRAAVTSFMAGLPTWEEVDATMRAINVAWGKVRESATLVDHPSVVARGSLAWIDDREGGARPVPQSPYRFSGAASMVRGPAPHRGEHNFEVLAEWLEHRREQVASFVQDGILHAESSQCGKSG